MRLEVLFVLLRRKTFIRCGINTAEFSLDINCLIFRAKR